MPTKDIPQRTPCDTAPHLSPFALMTREEPYGPSNGRKRIGLAQQASSAAHRFRCRDYGRRAQVATWRRLPSIRRAWSED